jgi:hypothetical protein
VDDAPAPLLATSVPAALAGPPAPGRIAATRRWTMGTTTTDQPPTPAPCAACGEAPAAPEDGAEQITHCEFCGAEYPVPPAGP